MNLKLIFGVILPSFIIILLIILSNLGELTVETSVVQSVKRSDMLSTVNSQSLINLYNETITNNYFMPIKYDLKGFTACIENKKTSLTVYQTIDELETEENYKQMYNPPAKNVEIAPGEKKVIRTFLMSYSGLEINTSDVILLIPKKDKGYINCYSLTDSERQDAFRILVT